jgi:hypothetical protein
MDIDVQVVGEIHVILTPPILYTVKNAVNLFYSIVSAPKIVTEHRVEANPTGWKVKKRPKLLSLAIFR